MSLRKKNRKVENILILEFTIFILILTVLVFEKVVPSSIQSITGKVISTVNITRSPQANCEIELYEGLNMASFFCISTITPITTVIGSLSNMDSIFEYQENSDDSWKSYKPGLPDFVIQDLIYMSRTEGYWMRMLSNESFFLEGKLRTPSYIYLNPGWNLVGYPTNEIKPINESFVSIEGNYTEVRAYNALTGSIISYVPGIGGALNQTQPNHAYWINSTVNEVWIFE